jgi:hypothetical protein
VEDRDNYYFGADQLFKLLDREELGMCPLCI